MKKSTFADILDAAGSFPVQEREELIDLLHKRAMEERRADLFQDIKSARSDYKNRNNSPTLLKP